MITWLLALLLVASVAALGFRQGVIKVAFSFVGIIVGALFAVPLGHLVAKLLPTLTIKNPLLLWALGPIIAFIIISAIFKIAAAPVHQKVDVHYKYKAGDLRLALWERVSHRLGLCLGVLNGVAYAILLSFLIYVPSYATIQLATSDNDPKWMRFLNLVGHGLNSSGMDKVARSLDRIPDVDYRTVDIGATIYRNGLCQARLSAYPPFLNFSESPQFVELGKDQEFNTAWLQLAPFMQIMDLPRIQAIRNDPELLKTLWYTTRDNVADLNTYLHTPDGESPKYDPIKILGRWRFDVPAAIAAIRRAKPAISSREMQGLRFYMDAAFGKASMVVKPDHQLIIKNIPALALPTSAAAAAAAGTPNLQNMQGEWTDLDGKYELKVGGKVVMGTVENERLTLKTPPVDIIFDSED